MADERVKIIDIQVRYQDAIEGIAKFRTALAEARKYQGDLKKALKEGTITQQQYDSSMAASNVYIKQQNDQIGTLSKQVNNQIKATREQEGSLKQLRAELTNATAKWDAMSRAERNSAKGQELRNHITEITTELKNAEAETQRFYRNVGNYKEATAGLDNLKVKIQDIGKQMMLALGGGSLLAFSKDVLQVTRDFQDGMARVRAVTNASAEDMQKMTDEARKMGRETIYHATDAAQAMENLARGGFNANESTAALSKTLQLAQANTISLDEASDLMIRTMRGFQLPISEAEMEHANDVLSKTAATSATNVLELGEALKNAAPFGHALNQSVEEVNAALGVLADVGVRGADAGTALRMVILGLSSPTAKQQKVFKEYGIEINQTSLQSEGLTKTLQRLKDSGIMEASNSAELLANVFGRRATPQVMALVGNIDRLGEKLTELSDAQGTTERMFEQSYSTVSQSVFSLSSAWESFKISLGESSSDALVAPLQGLTEAVRWLEAHLPELGSLIMNVLASISFAKLIQGAQSAFATIRTSAISNAESATATVQNLQREEIALRKTVAAQTAALENASGTERTIIETKVLANKRQLAEAEKALVKAKTAEVQAWETASAVSSGNAWTAAMATAGAAVRGFVLATKTALKGFIFTAVIMLAFEALQKLFSLFSEGDGWFSKLTSSVTGFIKKGLNFLINTFKTVSNYIRDFIENSRIMQVWLVAIKTNIAVLGAVFKSVWSIIKAGLKQMWNGFKAVAGIVGAVGTALEGLFTLNWTQMKRGIQQLGKTVTDFWKDTSDNAKQAGKEIAENVMGAYNDTVKAVTDAGNSKAFGGNGSSGGASTPKAPKASKSSPAAAPSASGESQEKDKPQTRYTEDAKKAKADWDNAKSEYQKLIKDQNATTEQVLAARKAMEEAQKSYEDLTGNKQSKSKSSSSRQDNAAKRAAELERKALEEAEKAMLDLMKDTASKRRAQLEKQYNDEIRKLNVRLNTEKNLTATAKEAIRQTILMKEQKKNEELAKLDDAELKREIQDRQKMIESRLSVVQKGSEEEKRLKQKSNLEKVQLDILAMKDEEENMIADAEEKLRIAQEQYGKESAMAYDAKMNLLEIERNFEERRNNIREAARQQNLQLEQQYQQTLSDQRQQAFQNQITEIEIAQQEQLLKDQKFGDGYIYQQEGLQQLNLDVVTQAEMDILTLRKQAAEQKYNDIVAAGQLENETVTQFEARKLQAQKASIDAKAALRKGELKNEQAYLKASQSMTNSLISLTSAIGESNEDFARLSKILTLVQITIDTGKALSGGIASASRLPYPANLAAIATTVATVLANIATAVSTVKSAKFAEGGKVYGPGTGTSDSIPARLSAGEYVMTAKATSIFEPLLAAMNNVGRGVVPMQATRAYRDYTINPNDLAQSFKDAAETIRPVVSVVEINERQQNVKVVENLDNI